MIEEKMNLDTTFLSPLSNEPNDTTKAAIMEAMSGHNPNKVYDNVDDMFNDILNEEWEVIAFKRTNNL